MGLKDLKKGMRLETEIRAKQMINPNALDAEANKFITAAGNRQLYSSMNNTDKKSSNFIRCIFSLNEEVSKEIDRISYLPKSFRAGRSDVVKAALSVLKAMPEDEIIKYLQSVTKNT